MPNPILAFYEAAQLTVPDDVDAKFPPILTNKIDPGVRQVSLEGYGKSLRVARAVADAISSRVWEIAGVRLSGVEIKNTSPRDGINLIRTIGRPPLITTLRGNQLVNMTPEELGKKEAQIYQDLGEMVRPLIVRDKTSAPALEPAAVK